MTLGPPRSTRAYTLLPYPARFRTEPWRRPTNIRARPRRQRAALYRQRLPNLDRGPREPLMDVVVADVLVPREAVLVAIAHLRGGVVRRQRGVDAGGDLRIGEHVAGGEIVGHHLADLDIGRDLLVLRSEEHTSELQSLMRISYAVFCLK